ncbi:MAG: hypothetical protein AVDCRST_MAG06-137, partial [uncultured Nocardioides sp.]
CGDWWVSTTPGVGSGASWGTPSAGCSAPRTARCATSPTRRCAASPPGTRWPPVSGCPWRWSTSTRCPATSLPRSPPPAPRSSSPASPRAVPGCCSAPTSWSWVGRWRPSSSRCEMPYAGWSCTSRTA